MKEDEKGPYIELADFLKFLGFVPTGGQAKLLIRSGEVKVNGEVETRVRRKLRNGFIVEHKGNSYTVEIEKFTKNP